MAAQIGNTCISGIVIDSVKIPKVMLGFSTVTSSRKVSPNDCSKTDNRQYLPTPAIFVSEYSKSLIMKFNLYMFTQNGSNNHMFFHVRQHIYDHEKQK